MAISVVVAVDPVGDDLVARIADRTGGIRVGDGARWRRPDREADMGPLVTREHADRVARLHPPGRGGRRQGRRRRPRRPRSRRREDGYWVGPTLFDHVTPDMSIYTEEIFGPVLSVVRVGSYARGST